METKRFWGHLFDDRREAGRRPADFYAIQVAGAARYLRKICNVSARGLLIEDRLAMESPGSIIDLELPRAKAKPLRVRAEIVYVTRRGKVGVRALDPAAMPVEGLGGAVAL